jgi:hypothetical protein
MEALLKPEMECAMGGDCRQPGATAPRVAGCKKNKNVRLFDSNQKLPYTCIIIAVSSGHQSINNLLSLFFFHSSNL